MFGFVRPLKAELRMREYDRFGQAYCGLCNAIKSRHGRLQTAFLSYDLTFYGLLLTALQPQEPQTLLGRCVANPLRKKSMQAPDVVLNFTADLHVLLSYYKLQDTIADAKGIQKWGAKLLAWCSRSAYTEVARLHPQIDITLSACMHELATLEREQTPSLDRPADCFARLLSACVPEYTDPTIGRILSQLLYQLGRWIYLIDACYDLPHDCKAGDYNPVALRYALQTGDLSTVRQPLTETLERSLLDIYTAYQLLPIVRDGDLLLNIITQGLPITTAQVLTQTYQPNGGKHGSL